MSEIVVTGIGIVSATGVGRQTFWQNCLGARSGIRPIEGQLEGTFRSPLAGLVTDFDPRRFLKPAVFRRMSRAARMAASACVEALEDSGLDLKQTDPGRIAIVVGTAHGSSASIDAFFLSLLAEGPRGAQPMYFPETVPNAPAGHIAMITGITGPNTTFGQNDISAENALVYARQLLLQDRVDAALVCGVDELNPMFFGCFDDLQALNPGLRRHGRLTPKMGAGIVMGEGAGAVMLEKSACLTKRGAQGYAIFKAGLVLGGPAQVGGYQGCRDTLQTAIEQVMAGSGLGPYKIDQISISANFSGDLEKVEAEALHNALSSKTVQLKVTPLRYLTGSFGSAGILSFAALAHSIRDRRCLPVIETAALTGKGEPPAWQVDPAGVTATALMTACTYGGGCAALILTEADESRS